MQDYAGVWQVRPSHPYKGPEPDILAEVVVEHWPQAEDKRPPPELLALCERTPGYSLWWTSRSYAAPRPWSKERRARERQRRLRERVQRKWPLFANQFIAEALASRSAYYMGEDPVFDVGRPGGPEES